jgi:short subunit dehydrogenase-like uncharacterized protein
VAEPSGPIVVYGASGYTGRLVVAELARRGLPHIVAGRSAARLRAAAAGAGTVAPVRTAALEDRDALRHLLGPGAVVVNCAGPFTRHGEAVVRAAVETGTHYLDTAGEQLFMQRVFERWGAAASAAEVAVVPGMGFDYLPGDLIAHLAAQGREPLRDLVVAYSAQGFGPTRGTARSALEIMRRSGLRYDGGEWQQADAGPLRGFFRYPEPVGRARVVGYPAGEVVTVPRHVRTRRVTALIEAATLAPHPAMAGVLPLAMAAAGLALRTPLRALAELAVDRRPEGPPEAERRAARYLVAAVAVGEDGAIGRGAVRGTDVYGLTAAIAAHGAALMAAEGFDRSGVLAPASAFEPRPFLDAMGASGLSYEVDPSP